MGTPNRAERRRLEAASRRVLEQARFTAFDSYDGGFVVLKEDGYIQAIPEELAPDVLGWLSLPAMWPEIVKGRASRPNSKPAVVIIEDWASLEWLNVVPMGPGGAA